MSASEQADLLMRLRVILEIMASGRIESARLNLVSLIGIIELVEVK